MTGNTINMISGNTSEAVTVRWKWKHLFITLCLLPFLAVLWKFGYKESLAIFLLVFSMFLAIETPKTGVMFLTVLLAFDMNPSTLDLIPNSIFTFIIDDKLIPIHFFSEIGLISGWVVKRSFIPSKKLKFTPAHYFFLMMILWIILAQISSILRGGSVMGALFGSRMLISFGLFLYIYDVIDTEEELIKLFLLVVISISITFLVGLFRLITDNYVEFGQRKFYLYKEQVQILHVLGLFALVAGLDKRIKFPMVAGAVIYLLCILHIFFSTSRAILVGAFATILLILFLKIKNKVVFIISIAMLAGLTLLAFNYFTNEISGVAGKVASGSIERLSTMSIENADLSVVFRLLSYTSAFNTAVDNPLLGIGFTTGYYLEMFGMRYRTGILDNTYLKYALSAGFPLLILYFCYLFTLYRSGIRLMKKYRSGIINVIVLCCIGVQCMGNVVDLFMSNFAYMRAMFFIVFMNAILMKLYKMDIDQLLTQNFRDNNP